MEYLFGSLDKLRERLVDKYLMLFLDFDGTLAPIAETPAKAVIPEEAKRLLRALSLGLPSQVAIISGRGLADLRQKIDLKNIIYVGNHGLELEGPKIKFAAPVSAGYKVILRQIKSDLIRSLPPVKGVFLEDKGLSLSLHYRSARKKDIARIKNIFDQVTMLYLANNKIKIISGKRVLEVRPPIAWDKGKIALWLLARQKFALKEKDIFPVYIGDDKADEDAFKALKNRGLTIFVGKPKLSYAQYYLKDTAEVRKFLRKIILWLS